MHPMFRSLTVILSEIWIIIQSWIIVQSDLWSSPDGQKATHMSSPCKVHRWAQKMKNIIPSMQHAIIMYYYITWYGLTETHYFWSGLLSKLWDLSQAQPAAPDSKFGLFKMVHFRIVNHYYLAAVQFQH